MILVNKNNITFQNARFCFIEFQPKRGSRTTQGRKLKSKSKCYMRCGLEKQMLGRGYYGDKDVG